MRRHRVWVKMLARMKKLFLYNIACKSRLYRLGIAILYLELRDELRIYLIALHRQVLSNPSWSMPPHCHAFHELIGMSEGRMTVLTPEGVIEAGHVEGGIRKRNNHIALHNADSHRVLRQWDEFALDLYDSFAGLVGNLQMADVGGVRIGGGEVGVAVAFGGIHRAVAVPADHQVDIRGFTQDDVAFVADVGQRDEQVGDGSQFSSQSGSGFQWVVEYEIGDFGPP